MSAVDAFVAYKFIKLMTTPFTETEAYKLGIIDEKGKVLKKRSKLNTPQEKSAYTILDTLVWNIKRIIEKIPAGKTRLGSFAAALYLLKEKHEGRIQSSNIFERALIWHLEDSGYEVEDRFNSFDVDYTSTSIERGTYVIDEQKILITQPVKSTTSYLGENIYSFGDTYFVKEDFMSLSVYNLMENKNRRVNETRGVFAGMPVYQVEPEDYIKSINGRSKFQRWSKHLDMENEESKEAKSFSHKNPGKPVLIQNSQTGEMTYLIHRS